MLRDLPECFWVRLGLVEWQNCGQEKHLASGQQDQKVVLVFAGYHQ